MFLTQIINGQVTDLSLCEKCARAKGLFDPQSLSFAEQFFPSMMKEKMEEIVNSIAQPRPQSVPSSDKMDNMISVCPTCSFRIEDFRNTGRLGCPHCYSIFAEEVFPSLEQCQTGKEHAGKEPEQSSKQAEVRQNRQQLEQQLKQAVAREDYELAAKLRDQLKEPS